MDETTQQNAALVEQAAAAAESLVEQAGSLIEVVSGFQLNVAGNGTSQHRKASKPIRAVSPVARAVPKPPAKTKTNSTKVLLKTGTDDNEWEEF
jgi:methyl-accepting chemotaxis protein